MTVAGKMLEISEKKTALTAQFNHWLDELLTTNEECVRVERLVQSVSRQSVESLDLFANQFSTQLANGHPDLNSTCSSVLDRLKIPTSPQSRMDTPLPKRSFSHMKS